VHEAHDAVAPDRRRPPVARERDGVDRPLDLGDRRGLVLGEAPDLEAGLHVPEARGPVVARGREPLPRERERAHAEPVARAGPDAAAALDLAHADGAVEARAREPLAVGRERDAAAQGLVWLELVDARARGRVPDRDEASRAGAGDALAVVRERAAV